MKNYTFAYTVFKAKGISTITVSEFSYTKARKKAEKILKEKQIIPLTGLILRSES